MFYCLDNIYQALYGTMWCDDTSELCSHYYYFESKGIWSDIVEKTTTLLESKFEVCPTDVAKIIYLAEDNHIGNDKSNTDLFELDIIAQKILKHIKLELELEDK